MYIISIFYGANLTEVKIFEASKSIHESIIELDTIYLVMAFKIRTIC